MPQAVTDLSRVLPRHFYVDERLSEWGRWVRVRPVINISPMFHGYKSKSRQWEEDPHISTLPPHPERSMDIERAVARLPDAHRDAVRWFYVWPFVPQNHVRRYLGATRAGLLQLIDDGRDMVSNQLRRAGK